MTQSVVRRIASGVVDTVFPPRCAGCKRRGWWVCPECLPGFPAIPAPACQRCGEPEVVRCRCAELTSAVDLARSAGWYEGWLRSAIGDFKYEGESARAAHLGAFLVPLLGEMPDDACLVPVPLHPKRERTRGYNQSLLLATVAAKHGNLPVRRLLARTRPTRQQVGLSAIERAGNVRGAFVLVPDSPKMTAPVVLIDDVMTTGSTLRACAEILKDAGAPFVGAVTLARER